MNIYYYILTYPHRAPPHVFNQPHIFVIVVHTLTAFAIFVLCCAVCVIIVCFINK